MRRSTTVPSVTEDRSRTTGQSRFLRAANTELAIGWARDGRVPFGSGSGFQPPPSRQQPDRQGEETHRHRTGDGHGE